MFACEHAQITPDILCLGKAITGGYMTLAATLCTDKVALDISQCEAGVLMHGPTFMANPLACAAANASLNLLMTGDWFEQVKQIEQGLRRGLQPCLELETVSDVRVLGAIGVVEMKQVVDVAKIQKQFIEYGLWIRPFGKLVYVMPQYVISEQDLTNLTSGIVNTLKAL
jgi:adenosylmethionine-8-amino-7-oxononanoate aminotransferase